MTSQSPRIYTYKITFEEVPYYYYGSKKEKYYNQEYWGSPVTHKWCWELYTPKKQILELFNFTDEGYEECRRVEDRLIKPFLNDPWCLNESCGGRISLRILRENGKKVGKKVSKYLIENKLGIHGWSKEQFVENGKKIGKRAYELGIGVHALTLEDKRKIGKKAGKRSYKLGVGIHALTPEQKGEAGKIGGKIGGKISGNRNKELGKGYCGLSKEERSSAGKIGGKISGKIVGPKNRELNRGICGMSKDEKSDAGKKGSKNTNSQKWMCLETGYISTPGPLTLYQKRRGIDTIKRIKI
jgi:hypothetical protein